MANVDIRDLIVDVAQYVRRCPTATLLQAYSRAAHNFFRQSRWWRVSVPGATAANTQVYSLGSDPYADIVGIQAMSGSKTSGSQTSYFALSPSDPNSWNPSFENQQPLTYSYVPEGQFALFPIPDAIYQLLVTVQVTPKHSATVLDENLLPKWRQAIEAGALAYLLNIPRQPWTDPTGAMRNSIAFQAAINNAKADEQRSFNTGGQMAKKRPFVV